MNAFVERIEQVQQSSDARQFAFDKINTLLKTGKPKNKSSILTSRSTNKLLKRIEKQYGKTMDQESLFNEISDEVILASELTTASLPAPPSPQLMARKRFVE